MTFSEPLVELVLDAIRGAPRGNFLESGLADRLEAERVRALTPGERLEELNALMLRAEALKVARPLHRVASR